MQTLINVIPFGAGRRFRRVTYQQVLKRCGNPRCQMGCPTPSHGPYWMRAEYSSKGHVKRSTYVGKTLPREGELALIAQRLLLNPNLDLFKELADKSARIAQLEQQLVEIRRDLRNARRRRPAGLERKSERRR